MAAEKIAHFIHGNAYIRVDQMFDRDGYEKGYRLSWDDGVANEWVETYPALSLAMARVAALVACLEESHRTFTHDELEFVSVADAFLYGVAR
jgi:hypothetical protein